MPPEHRDPAGSAQATAERILLAASQSEAALRRKLGERGYDGEEIDEAITRLTASGMMDDRALADSIVRRALRSGHGLLYARKMLETRGLAREIIGRSLAEVASDDELESAQQALQRQSGKVDRMRGYQAYAARRGYLERRGFSAQTASRAAQVAAEFQEADPDDLG